MLLLSSSFAGRLGAGHNRKASAESLPGELTKTGAIVSGKAAAPVKIRSHLLPELFQLPEPSL